MAGSGPDTQGETVLPWHWPSEGGVEGKGGGLNFWLTVSITFHNFLHGFWAGRVIGTATLEAKLVQQLAALREEVLYVIFLDLHKAYDALDSSKCLEIL